MSAYLGFNLLAAFTIITYANWVLKREGMRWMPLIVLNITAVMAFFIGSRLLYGVLYFEKILQSPQKLVEFRLVNFSLYGGLILSVTFYVWSLHRSKMNLWQVTDKIVPAVGVAIAISKLGCFFNGCCYGIPTKMPWGMVFERVDQTPISRMLGGSTIIKAISGVTLVPRHPTQLYEVFFALLASAVAVWLTGKHWHRRGKKGYHQNGVASWLFVLIFTSGRLFSFLLRDFPSASAVSNFIRGPVVYGMIYLVTAFVIYTNAKKNKGDLYV